VAEAAGELLLCEAAPGLRARLQKQFAGHPKVRVVARTKSRGCPSTRSI
jgi:hypothetical protein